MASKFMVNAAFETYLLLRPSHQRTVIFGVVNRLGCPIPGRLSSGSYSEWPPIPPLPKNPRDLLRAHSLLGLRISTGSLLKSGSSRRLSLAGAWPQLDLYAQALFAI